MMRERRCRICGSAPLNFACENGKEFYYCTKCGDRGDVCDLCKKQFGMNHLQTVEYLDGIDKLPAGIKTIPFHSLGVSQLKHLLDNIGAEQIIKIAQNHIKQRDKL